MRSQLNEGQLRASISRKWLTALRNKKFWLFVFVPPLLLSIVTVAVLSSELAMQRLGNVTPMSRDMESSSMDASIVPFVRSPSMPNELSGAIMQYMVAQGGKFEFKEFDTYDNLSDWLFDTEAEYARFGGLLFNSAVLVNDSTSNNEKVTLDRVRQLNITLLYNSTAEAALPQMSHALQGAIYALFNGEASARLVERSRPMSQETVSSLLSLIGPIAISFAIAVSTGAFGMSVIEERERGIKQYMYMSGLSPLAYWMGNFIVDLCAQLTVACACLLLYIVARGQELSTLAIFGIPLLMFLFCPNAILMAYSLSFFFSKAETAFKWFPAMINISVMATLVVAALTSYLAIVAPPAIILVFLLCLVPFYALMVGIGFIVLGLGSHVTGVYAMQCLSLLVWPLLLRFVERRSARAGRSGALSDEERKAERERRAVEESEIADEVREEARSVEEVWRAARAHMDASHMALNDDEIERDTTDDSDGVLMRNVRKWYGGKKQRKFAVRGVTLRLRAGECFGLLGPNGAGKSTLISVLCGQLAADDGHVRVGGCTLPAQRASLYRRLGVCPQFDCLFDTLSVREHLRLFARLKRVRGDQIEAECVRMAESVELDEYMERRAAALSGGTRRKLSLALALLGDPHVVLLDECTTGMDVLARRKTWNIIGRLRAGRTFLVTTHNMEEAEALCTRIGIMIDGRLRALGTEQHLKATFGNEYRLDVTADAAHSEQVAAFVERVFDSAVRLNEYGSTLRYALPSATFSLLDAMRTMEANKQPLHIADYALTQATLEHVFLRLVNQAESAREQREAAAAAAAASDGGAQVESEQNGVVNLLDVDSVEDENDAENVDDEVVSEDIDVQTKPRRNPKGERGTRLLFNPRHGVKKKRRR